MAVASSTSPGWSLASARAVGWSSSAGGRGARQHGRRGVVSASSTKGFGRERKPRAESLGGGKVEDKELRELAGKVGDELAGVDVFLVGRPGCGKCATAKALAPLLGYVPLDFWELTQSTLEAARRSDPGGGATGGEEEDEISGAEKELATELSTFVRVVCAVSSGACVSDRNWAKLHAGVTVWMRPAPGVEFEDSELDGSGSEFLPGHAFGSFADDAARVDACFAPAEVVVTPEAGDTPEVLAARVLAGVARLLDANRDTNPLTLAQRKSLYLKLGARGDWPNIQMPKEAQDMAQQMVQVESIRHNPKESP